MRTAAVVLCVLVLGGCAEETQPAGQPAEETTTEEATTEEEATEDSRQFILLGCSNCHTLADAGSGTHTGPDLDNALRGKDADFVRESIVNPDAEVAQGFQPGVMPGDYGERLSDEQLDGLVEYLLQAVEGS
jgi:mono/diheme cytochrome c family protein